MWLSRERVPQLAKALTMLNKVFDRGELDETQLELLKAALNENGHCLPV